VFTSAAFRDGRGGAGVVIRASGQTAHVLRRAVRARSPAEAAYRALVYGLWRARAAGVRRLQVYTDARDVAAQLAGEAEVPADLTGLYLQARALLNAYRWAAVAPIARARNGEAVEAAIGALDLELADPDLDAHDGGALPLFPGEVAAR